MLLTKVHIATSRPVEIGSRCRQWAIKNLPPGFNLTKDLQECDIFISVLYDKLITQEYIDARRCYNFHPGILPDYRGSGVYSWALINRERETGVTLHEIDFNIDSGPIIAIHRTLITEQDTAETLFIRCMDLLYNMFTGHFSQLLLNDYPTRLNRGGKLYLREDLDKAKDITHLIRGFSFRGKESAYWVDSAGNKQYVEWA